MFIGLFSPIQLEKYLQQSRSPRGPETDMEHDDKPIQTMGFFDGEQGGTQTSDKTRIFREKNQLVWSWWNSIVWQNFTKNLWPLAKIHGLVTWVKIHGYPWLEARTGQLGQHVVSKHGREFAGRWRRSLGDLRYMWNSQTEICGEEVEDGATMSNPQGPCSKLLMVSQWIMVSLLGRRTPGCRDCRQNLPSQRLFSF